MHARDVQSQLPHRARCRASRFDVTGVGRDDRDCSRRVQVKYCKIIKMSAPRRPRRFRPRCHGGMTATTRSGSPATRGGPQARRSCAKSSRRRRPSARPTSRSRRRRRCRSPQPAYGLGSRGPLHWGPQDTLVQLREGRRRDTSTAGPGGRRRRPRLVAARADPAAAPPCRTAKRRPISHPGAALGVPAGPWARAGRRRLRHEDREAKEGARQREDTDP